MGSTVKYRANPGFLLDMTSFLTQLYNESFVLERFSSEDLIYYRELKSNLKEDLFSPEIHSFVYSGDQINSFLNKIVSDLPYENLSFVEFIGYISSEQFTEKFLSHWFGQTSNSFLKTAYAINNVDFVLVDQINIPESIKFRLIKTLYHFNESRDRLIKLLYAMVAPIQALRKKHETIMNEAMDQKNTEGFLNAYSKKYRVSKDYIKSLNYTMVLVNPKITHITSQGLFILGINQFDTQEDLLDKVTIYSFALAYGDSTRKAIVDIIGQHGETSIYTLCEELNMKLPTMYHHLGILLTEGIIIVSKATSRKYYYSINEGYFSTVSSLFERKFNKAIGAKKPLITIT